jgi:hypothetical protein
MSRPHDRYQGQRGARPEDARRHVGAKGSPRPALDLGALPSGRAMVIVDEGMVRAPLRTIFDLARDVERWPEHLSHYRYVRFVERATDGGGIVDMSAYRMFGPLPWPTFWRSEMQVVDKGAGTFGPLIRYRHIGGITTGMDVAWEFAETRGGTHVRIVHVWDGPRVPFVGPVAATTIIGPIFVHGIASRTLAGLTAAAERREQRV